MIRTHQLSELHRGAEGSIVGTGLTPDRPKHTGAHYACEMQLHVSFADVIRKLGGCRTFL